MDQPEMAKKIVMPAPALVLQDQLATARVEQPSADMSCTLVSIRDSADRKRMLYIVSVCGFQTDGVAQSGALHCQTPHLADQHDAGIAVPCRLTSLQHGAAARRSWTRLRHGM